MLYPSLAVADVPATNFGPVCLFARVPLVVRMLKPYKQRTRGRPAVTVYNTDAWTDVTRDFVGSRAAELFDQLTGRWEIRYAEHMMTLGPRIMEDVRTFGPDVKRLTSMSQLRTALNRKRGRWHEGMTAEQIEQASDGTDLKYPYCEAKVNGILRIADTFQVAVCPSYMKARVSKFLTAIGFNGALLTVPVKGELKNMLEDKWKSVEDAAKGQWDYAWLVREKVLEWVEKQDAGKKPEHRWLQDLDIVDHGFLGKYSPLYNQVPPTGNSSHGRR
jgi:hypothetical protein